MALTGPVRSAEERLGRRAEARGGFALAAYEVLRFGLKQAWACLVGALMLILMIMTFRFYPAGTWLYPQQAHHWTMVPLSKLSSWLLLMIVSYALVAWVNGVQSVRQAGEAAGTT